MLTDIEIMERQLEDRDKTINELFALLTHSNIQKAELIELLERSIEINKGK